MPWPGPEPRHASAADRAACGALLRDGSKTFFAASRLLPLRLRGPATVLYAFCRIADDAADLDGGRPERTAHLRLRLARVYEGRPLPLPVDRALADLVVDFGLPRELLEALFEGFEWDAAGRRYEELADLLAYAARVAGTVGVMMSLMMGRRAPGTVARACELGMAMQLTNIARDVGEDARAGRLYLPLAWLRQAGIEHDAWLAAPAFSPALAGVVARLLVAADGLYRRAEGGIGELPLDCRPGIRAARLLYAEIGAELGQQGLDSVTHRAVVPGRRKVRLLARALGGTPVAAGKPSPLAPLPAARFLIDAVIAAPAPAVEQPGPAWWNLDEQVGRMLELVERADRRREMGGA
jgi:15-cis-phytoene synthase